jgi:cytoskeletal protein RodZ
MEDNNNVPVKEDDGKGAAENQPSPGSRSEKNRKKKKGRAGKTVLKVVIWIIIIAAAIFLTLYLASKIGEFESIGDMLNYIRAQF